MDEHLKLLAEKIDLLSKKVDESGHEINLLKAEIAKLKGENIIVAKQQAAKKIKQVDISSPGLENFVGLKLIHFVGIIVLLIGLSIGVKYAIDANLISPLLRIILAYAAGAILFILSLRLKEKFFVFSVILFSGAMASAYFTTYAAFEYYSIFPRLVAFGLMLLLTIFTVFNSLKYNRQEIALLGLTGAYAIPFFVGDNSGNIAALFTYMLLINGGILFISLKKYWQPLIYISFFATWIIFAVVMLLRFDKVHFNTFNITAFAFFLFFLFNCLAFKFVKKEPLNASDTFIILINSFFLYLTLNFIYSEVYNTSISFITLLFAIAYFTGGVLAKKFQPLQAHFSNTLFTIAFIMLTAFVAMKYEGFTITIVWVLMAIVVFIIGMAWKMKPLRISSIALFAVTIIKLLLTDSNNFSAVEKIIAWVFTGAVLLAVSFLYQKFKQQIFTDGE